MCETDEFIILCDPWLEGTAFNNGWALLDNSTKNDLLLDELSHSQKKIYIWFSHEHSDHFAIPFLKKLKGIKPETKFFFQTTEDDRVVSFLRSNDFDVEVLKDGQVASLSNDSWISISSWYSGDSLSIMSIKGFTILNLNDCIISTKENCNKVKNLLLDLKVQNLDMLFTQFGYASWCGNEDDVEARKSEADEKLRRIVTQLNILHPSNTVLFASFVYFSSDYNFYLNDCQNTPISVRNSIHLKPYNNDVYFMKPLDCVVLDENLGHALSAATVAAEKHWQDAYTKAEPIEYEKITYALNDIIKAFKSYKLRVHGVFIGIFALIELIGAIKPLKVHLVDLNKVVKLSYLRRTITFNALDEWDIAMSSDDLMFSITRDFGFDCTHVNGRFRVASKDANNKFLYFSGPQNMLKQGFGFRKPFKTIKEFMRLAKR
jgi:hypothetical protein